MYRNLLFCAFADKNWPSTINAQQLKIFKYLLLVSTKEKLNCGVYLTL